jgi:hypothetical protein
MQDCAARIVGLYLYRGYPRPVSISFTAHKSSSSSSSNSSSSNSSTGNVTLRVDESQQRAVSCPDKSNMICDDIDEDDVLRY